MPSDREGSFHPSDIWQKLQRRFLLNAHNQGYGINFNIDWKILNLFVFSLRLFDYFFIIIKIQNKLYHFIRKIYASLLSYFLFKDRNAHRKFGLSKYSFKDYDHNLVKEFKTRFPSIGFSHNTLKCFYYLTILEKNGFFHQTDNRRIRILEIGPGNYNFAKLLLDSYHYIDYVTIDLPEMTKYALESFQSFQLNAELAHLTTTDLHLNCKNVITILNTGDISKLNGTFDLFLNTESFSEMEIKVVNNYLNLFDNFHKGDSWIFLVNRFIRFQTFEPLKVTDTSKVTDFFQYELHSYETKYFGIDMFRNRINNEKKNPNFVFIGVKS